MTTSSSASSPPRPVVLCILDGWGDRDASENNAIALGKTPNWDRFVGGPLRAQLSASAADVGLPAGQMGNSEVGHMTLGAGRVVPQDLPRIDAAVADGSLATNPALQDFIAKLKHGGGTCHLFGLLSSGGVHAHVSHIVALVRAVADAGVPVAVHAVLDGRDTPPRSAADEMKDFLAALDGLASVRVVTVSGRYYAMDRDRRWDRVERAYRTIAEGKGDVFADPLTAITASYDADVGDEFVLPVRAADYAGMADGDGILSANFRADRAREILTALADPGFDAFHRDRPVSFAALAGMVEYSSALNERFTALFPPPVLTNTLGRVVSDAGLNQLRIAETEKYAHVTFFFNGGREDVYPGEERILVPSPKVATYDLQPEMSAPEVTDRMVAAIESGTFDLIIANYANGDMVGHTGKLDAAIAAVETVDACLGRLEAAVLAAGGVLIVTADHGNCEQMAAGDNPHTAHTTNLVPVVMVGARPGITALQSGGLADMAPTILALMGLKQPDEMTGQSLIKTDAAAQRAAS